MNGMSPWPPDETLTVTPEDLDHYIQCPYRLWFDTRARAEGKTQLGVEAAVEVAISKALEMFFSAVPPSRDRELLERCLRSVWPEATEDVPWSIGEEAPWGEWALGQLGSYLARADLEVEPLSVGRTYSMRLAKPVSLSCQVDRVDGVASVDPDGVMLPLPDEVSVVSYSISRDGQVAQASFEDLVGARARCLAVEESVRRVGVRVGRFEIVCLGLGGEIASWEVTEDDLTRARREITELSLAMTCDRAFDPNPDSHCQRCPYQEICHAAIPIQADDEIPVVEELRF